MKKFRLIIAGTRSFSRYKILKEKVLFIISFVDAKDIEIVSGACDSGVLTFTRKDGTKVYGADGLGERLADEYNFPIKYFPADWDKYGKAAGPIRNEEMSLYGTNCIIFWDGKSKGTFSMINSAKKNIGSATIIQYRQIEEIK
jgi:hypothetical protein